MKRWIKPVMAKLPFLIVVFPALIVPIVITERHDTELFWDNFFRQKIVDEAFLPAQLNTEGTTLNTFGPTQISEMASYFDLSMNEAYQLFFMTQTTPQDIIYTVQEDEGLWEIAEKYNLPVEDIIVANDIVHIDYLAPGREIIIPVSGPPGRDTSIFAMFGNATGSLLQDQYTVRPGDTVDKIAANYGLSASTIIDANNINGSLRSGQILTLPEDYQYIIPAVGRLYWPINLNHDFYISNYYQPGHLAIDIVLDEGLPVLSMADGYVATAEWSELGYGNVVVIDHGNSFYSLYGHLESIHVEEGDYVNREAIIGFSGNTGNSVSPHLHLELKEGLRFLDPCLYLPGYCLWEN